MTCSHIKAINPEYERPTYEELQGALQWLMDGLADDYCSHVDPNGDRHDYIENAARVLVKAGGHADKALLP